MDEIVVDNFAGGGACAGESAGTLRRCSIMPNWCEGNIRIRGTSDRIARFFINELCTLIPIRMRDELSGETQEEYEIENCVKYKPAPIIVEMSQCGTMVIRKSEKALREFYIRGTRRHYIASDTIELDFASTEDDGGIRTLCVDGFRAAWQIDPEPFIQKAIRHGVDIRIVGFERGFKFVQRVTIDKNGKYDNDEVHVANWDWDCLFPNMGG